jgi:multiple sugar transport system permease protein
MLAPALIYVIVLAGIPFVLAILLSFSNAAAGSLRFSFVGLRNFLAILPDPLFQRAVWNTVIITVVSQVAVIILAGLSGIPQDIARRPSWTAPGSGGGFSRWTSPCC